MNFFRFILSRRRIFTILVVVLPIVAGTFSYQVMPKEGNPEISAPHAIVITHYPGASPGEIENLVTYPIEEALSDLKNVEEMRSSSAEGVSIVVVDFDVEADLERSLQKVREKVMDARRELPDDAEDPTVEEISFSDIPIMLISVVGDLDPVRLKKLAEQVADEIELLPEVLSTEVTGGLTREIQIYLDPERLDQYGLTLLDVFNAVKQSDINIPGGMVNVEGRRFILRTLSEIKRVEEYARVPLVMQGDRVVFLGDVATVKDGHSEDVTYSRVDGSSSATISVKKRTGANILETSAKVLHKTKELEKDFPYGVHMAVTANQAKYIKQGFDIMYNSAVTGLMIVILVLWFAMGLRNSVITSLSVPLSLLITFILLKTFGIPNNDMVRFSLVLCIGMLVDNAIIVVENVYHHYQLGKDRLAAVIEGASEIALPVISATLTTMAAFLPMLLMTGTTGEYMGFMPKTVSIALLSSLIVALVASPLILSLFMKQTLRKGRIVSPEEDLRLLKIIYVRGVTWALNHRMLLVFTTFACLLIAGNLVRLKVIKVEMFPDIDFDYIYITVETPRGTDVSNTDGVARRIEGVVKDHVPEAVKVVSTVGYKGQSAYEFSFGSGVQSHFAEITVELLDGKEYARASHKDIQKRIRPMLDAIPGAMIHFRPISWGPPILAPIVVKVKGPDLEILRRITLEIKDIMVRIPGMADVKDDVSDAPPEIRVKIDREAAASLGVPLDMVATSLRGATAGLDVKDFRDELDVSKKYDLKVRYAPEHRTTPRMLEKVRVRSTTGAMVPLTNIADFSQGPGINEIRHVDRRRVVRLTARNSGRSAIEISKELRGKLAGFDLPKGYTFDFEGEYKETEESFASLKLAYVVAFILIFTLLVTQFNSYLQPFAIMAALPLSVVGAMVGLLITHNHFTIMSFIGLVGLTGIVVNDSIVLVDCINRTRKQGMDIFHAIVAAGQQRLRPIISTTLSTIGGIFTLTITDKLWEGLGVVIIFGIGFATILTLVVVPVMYSLFESFGAHVNAALRGPRLRAVPEGKGFLFTRRRFARLKFFAIILIQVALLLAGVQFLAPHFLKAVQSTIFQAPTPLKLVIEILVFWLGLGFRALGVLFLLLIPTWLGLVYLMGLRSAESRFVDVTPEGATVMLPGEKLFLSAGELSGVKYSRLLGRITVKLGRRKVRIRKVLQGIKPPAKIPLRAWLAGPSPSRADVREGMLALQE
ncbi:MAG: efflux RND transporter permease subunit, partial [Pseudomonadota bacterium]